MTDDRSMKRSAGGPEGPGTDLKRARGETNPAPGAASPSVRSSPFTASAPMRPGFGRQSFGLHGFAAQADAGPAPAGNLASQFGLAVGYADPRGLSELARHFQAPLPEAAADLPRVATTLTGARHASLWPGPLSPPPAPQDVPQPAPDVAGSSPDESGRDSRADHVVPVPQVLELGNETLAVLRGIEAQLATLTRLVEAQAVPRQPDEPSEPFGEITHGDATQPMTWPPLGESIENLPDQSGQGAAEPALPGVTQGHEPDGGVAFAGDRRLDAASEAADAELAQLPATPGLSPDLPQRALFPAGSADPQSMAEEAERIARIHRASLAARQAAEAVRDSSQMPGEPAFARSSHADVAPALAPAPVAPAPLAAVPAAEAAAAGSIVQNGEPSGWISFLAFAVPRWLALIAVILVAGIVLHLLTGGTLDTLPAGLVSAEWWGSLFSRIYRMLERIDRFMLDLFAPIQRVLGA